MNGKWWLNEEPLITSPECASGIQVEKLISMTTDTIYLVNRKVNFTLFDLAPIWCTKYLWHISNLIKMLMESIESKKHLSTCQTCHAYMRFIHMNPWIFFLPTISTNAYGFASNILYLIKYLKSLSSNYSPLTAKSFTIF